MKFNVTAVTLETDSPWLFWSCHYLASSCSFVQTQNFIYKPTELARISFVLTDAIRSLIDLSRRRRVKRRQSVGIALIADGLSKVLQPGANNERDPTAAENHNKIALFCCFRYGGEFPAKVSSELTVLF
jgi:hypothetical protein